MVDNGNQRPDDPDKRGSVGGAWGLFFLSLILLVTIGLGAQSLSLKLGLLITEVFLILLPAVVYVRKKKLPVPEALRWRGIAPGIAVRCVLLGTLGWGMAIVLYLITAPVIESALGADPSGEVLVRALPKTLPELGVFLIVMAVLPGLCEETLFRGAIQGTFEKKGAWKAVGYTALLFGAYHVNPWTFIPAAGLGVLLGVITIRTNSTVASMISHTCNNTAAITVAFLYRDKPTQEPYALVAVFAILFVVVLVEFLYRTRGAQRRPSPLTTVPGGLSRGMKRVLIAATSVFGVLLVLVIIVFLLFIGSYRMTTDQLDPEVKQGEYVIVLKNRCVDVTIAPGDVVAFKRNQHTYMRKVVKVDDDSVWIRERTPQGVLTETRISRADVFGKMICKLPWAPRGSREK